MSKVTCHLTISADGYAAGPNQTEERPFGDDGGDGWGNTLHSWMFDNADENRAELDQGTKAGAYIMGRNMFGPVRGEWARLFDGVPPLNLEQVYARAASTVTHVTYRVPA